MSEDTPPNFNDVLNPNGIRYYFIAHNCQELADELNEIKDVNIKFVIRALTKADIDYLDHMMHFLRKPNNIDINYQEARRYLANFIQDHPILRTISPRKLLALITAYFTIYPDDAKLNEQGIPRWAIPYIPVEKHF